MPVALSSADLAPVDLASSSPASSAWLHAWLRTSFQCLVTCLVTSKGRLAGGLVTCLVTSNVRLAGEYLGDLKWVFVKDQRCRKKVSPSLGIYKEGGAI